MLYAASTAQGCFAETLARFRPSPGVAAAVRGDPGYLDPGGIPAAWRQDRRLVSFSLAAPLPFVDIDDTSTLLALGAALHADLAPLGVDELDRGGVYHADRRLTRLLASWVYSRTDDDGQPRYGGIRYESRLGRQWECWAIFDGALLTTVTPTPIDRGHRRPDGHRRRVRPRPPLNRAQSRRRENPGAGRQAAVGRPC